ncbi:helix-turn-helix transcriptional regulator [Gordonia sp. LSe1-13]|uniref:Helix-turn-helix transcriptional regulator n=1 Tax=Gordonia sesuvii TaxID=3116777 RepID=A0ABU7MDC6_9ACTN|nr:helix-turn-helix transcriptional regulator [Gordonia sp. LSe1-13]
MTEVYGGPRRQFVASHAVPPYFASAAGSTLTRPGLARERVDRWQARFVGADSGDEVHRFRGSRGLADFLGTLHVTSTDSAGFDAIVHSRRVGAITIVDCIATPCSVLRSTNEVVEPADAELVLLIPSSGGRLTMPGRPDQTFRAGQLVILSSAEPAEMSVTDVCETVMLTVPIAALGRESAGVLRRLSPISADTALVRATTTFLRRFGQTPSTRVTSERTTDAAQRAVIGLVTSVLAQQSYRAHSLVETTRSIRERTRELVERRFRDPDFAAPDVARELHLSRRQFYRHFAGSGTTPSDVIADRRVAEVRALLTDRPDMSMSEVARAAGFSSTSTMRNRFRDRTGVTPAEFRSQPPGEQWDSEPLGPGEVCL